VERVSSKGQLSECGVILGTGSPKPLELVEVDDGVFDCTYYPTQEGAPCRLDVTYDDEHVPGRCVYEIQIA